MNWINLHFFPKDLKLQLHQKHCKFTLSIHFLGFLSYTQTPGARTKLQLQEEEKT